ncbi:hypothetical protein E0L36_25195 [Streptomyces sp. AJS327]|uniref:hypothetical protein n=1 Tax=Streptomyces sp. AJS327 TaxID=2545265 RepID=UPI0015DF9A08|nr:hypothetical protein [Streptomyces sp. AJS327]MBA0054026.1 hypothetical protein [Streptomyces sp. AJS327]
MLHDLSAPIAALTLLMTRRDLPAGHIKITSIHPDRLKVSFHDQPADFDQWLAALGLTPLDGTTTSGDGRVWTTVTTTVGGATVELTSFTLAGQEG